MSQAHSNQPLYVSTGNPETVSDSPSKIFAPGQAGKYISIKQPGPAGSSAGSAEDYRDKTYRYILTDSTMTVTPYDGAVAWWKDKSRYMVTTSPTATSRGQVAGVFKGAPTAGHWAFIQTSGPGAVKFVDAPTAGAIAVGQSVIPSATAAKADTIAIGTAPTYPTLGIIAADPGTANPSGSAASQVWVVDLFVPEQP